MERVGDSITDVSLIGRVARDPDDRDSWRVFVDRYAPKIYAWCRAWKLQDADAQDVTQAVLTRLSVRMGRFVYDPSKSFRGWLRTLAQHAWSDVMSDRKRHNAAVCNVDVHELLMALEARDDLARRLEEEFDREMLEEACRRVRTRVAHTTWEAYRLTAVEGQTGAEVAAKLGIKVATVFVAKSNVLKRLQEEVRSLGGD